MPFVQIRDERIFYTHHPSDSALNLVLIHGSGGTHAHWPEGLRSLDLASVYALDLPGHGASGGKGRTSVQQYADFIQDFVQALGLENLVLAGHSLGGAIAQTLGLRRDGDGEDGVIRGGDVTPPYLSLVGLILVGTGARLRVDPAILDRLLTDFPGAIDTICEFAFGPEASAELVAQCRAELLKNNPAVIHADYDACDRFDQMEAVSCIRVPTGVISGEADRLTPVKYGNYLYNKIPNAQHCVIPNAGHMMTLEKPEAITHCIAKIFPNTRQVNHIS